MTQVTPPGWYPDPGQTSDGPRLERWWDGAAWTDQVRPAGTGPWGQPAVAGPWGQPGYPAGGPLAPPGRPRPRLRTAIGIGVVVVVLACLGAGVYALTEGGDDSHDTSSQPGPRSSHSDDASPGRPGAPGGSPGPGPKEEDGYATDRASGIRLPVPDGWRGESGQIGAQVTVGAYKCPGDPSQKCVRGGVFSVPAAALKLTQSTPREVAEADIAKNAEESYGGTTYGTISSHHELAARSVDVAGQHGYLVRWKVVTSKSSDGYVESLAFPSPADSSLMVVVRFGFDASDRAPKPAKMDEITRGIKPAAGAGGSGKQV